MILRCEKCGFIGMLGRLFLCPKCNGRWRLFYSTAEFHQFENTDGVWRYSSSLPVLNSIARDELVGNTLLVDMSSALGRGNVLLKDETQNPTRSYKDRGIIVGAGRAVEDGYSKWFVSSSGNAAHSVAYFAHKVGTSCWVELPEESGIAGICKSLGATVTYSNGRLELLLGRLYALLSNIIAPDVLWRFFYLYKYKSIFIRGWYPLQPHDLINPYIGEGYKTIAYEICDEIGNAPDYIFVPSITGNGINGIYRGFLDYLEMGNINKLPKMIFSRPVGKFMFKSLLPGSKEVINNSNGSVVGYQHDGLTRALIFLNEKGFFVSEYGASGLAAFMQMVEKGIDFSQKQVVILLTGGRK